MRGKVAVKTREPIPLAYSLYFQVEFPYNV